jgi:hypothetical protein
MSDQVTFDFDPRSLEGFQRVVQDLAPPAIRRAGARAINRGLTSGKTVMVREVAAALGVKQAAVKRFIGSRNATADRLEGRVYAFGKRGIPLIDLDAKGPEPSRGQGAGVRVRATPGQFPNAFIAISKTGKRAVFERVGRARLPIQQLFTRRIPDVWREARGAGVTRAAESLRTNLVSEIRYLLKKL